MPLRIFSTLAVQGALPALAVRHEELSGVAAQVVFAPTNGLMARIEAGETADVAILTREGVDRLVRSGLLADESAVDLARSYVGIAVKAGAAKPDIGSVAGLKATLLQAKSIAYSRIGASGIFFAALIERLGIANAVNAKATIIPGGFTAELAARGEVELAVQQVSELIHAPDRVAIGGEDERSDRRSCRQELVGNIPAAELTVVECVEEPFLVGLDALSKHRSGVRIVPGAHIRLDEVGSKADPRVTVSDEVVNRLRHTARVVRCGRRNGDPVDLVAGQRYGLSCRHEAMEIVLVRGRGDRDHTIEMIPRRRR